MLYNGHRGGFMSIKDRTTHLMVMLPIDLLEEIEEYRDENRIRGKHETIRTLIKKGLTSSEE